MNKRACAMLVALIAPRCNKWDTSWARLTATMREAEVRMQGHISQLTRAGHTCAQAPYLGTMLIARASHPQVSHVQPIGLLSRWACVWQGCSMGAKVRYVKEPKYIYYKIRGEDVSYQETSIYTVITIPSCQYNLFLLTVMDSVSYFIDRGDINAPLFLMGLVRHCRCSGTRLQVQFLYYIPDRLYWCHYVQV